MSGSSDPPPPARQTGEPGAVAGGPHAATGGFVRLTNLQALRAAAAFLVLIAHCATEIRVHRRDVPLSVVDALHLGSIGVAVFFAISGYLMAILVRSTSPQVFLLHRIARIYPIFLIVAAAYIALGAAIGLDVRRDWLGLTLVPAGRRGYTIGVEWTLLYETSFYVILFIVSVVGLARRVELVAGLWLAAIAAAYLAGSAASEPTLFPRLHYVPFSSITGAFVLGLLAPAAIARRLVPARLCLAALAIWVVAVAWSGRVDELAVVAIAPVALALAVQLPQVSERTWPGAGLSALGNWSYALYLVHMPAIMAVLRFTPREWPVAAHFVLCAGAAIAASAAFGSLDIALYRRLRRVVDRLSARRAALAAGAFALAYLGIGTTIGAQIEIDERDAARAREAVSGALVEARRSGVDLPRAIEVKGRMLPPSVAAKVDKALAIPIDLIEVAGWAVDLDAPDARFHLAIVCDGRIAAMASPTRLRPDVAAGLSRPDLRRRRIGFSLIFSASACPKGAPLSPVFVDPAYRLLAAPPVTPAAPAE
jgi:peptidoglycan/LPS O-acetylase OafA/YrhL